MAKISKKCGRIKAVLELEPEELLSVYCVLNSTVGGNSISTARKYLDRVTDSIRAFFPDLKYQPEELTGKNLFKRTDYGSEYVVGSDAVIEKISEKIIK